MTAVVLLAALVATDRLALDARRAGAQAAPSATATTRPQGQAYWMAAADGGVFAFGDARFFGSTGSVRLNQPVVGMAATPSGHGYWLVASDGGVFAFGDARFLGSTGSVRLNQPVVGMAATPSGNGYWLVASDGGVFAFGDAGFHGSTGAIRLHRPVVGVAASPSGRGYRLVASDGGVFAFGDAGFHGSMGNRALNRPVLAATTTPTGLGYWLTAADGGIFAFGDARFFGSTGSVRLNQPVVGMTTTPTGLGYWLTASDGGVFAFGDAGFHGSMGNRVLNRPVVGMAAHQDTRPFEVWAIDQFPPAGTIHVYDGRALSYRPAAAVAEVVDLGGAASALCTSETGVAPTRAHMLLFNGAGTHAIVSYVASGHVLFLDARNRAPVRCLRASPGAGGARQAHAAYPVPGDGHVVVANQNGKLLERIDTDADGDGTPYEGAADIAPEPAATLDLAGCTTPSGAACQDPTLRPDNAPICPIVDSTGRLVFVTLRGGGLLVVDARTQPMAIVGEYDAATVHPNGCGGVERAGRMYLNTGGGTAANPVESDVYVFPLAGFPATGANPPNQPPPATLLSRDAGDHDSHGMALVPTLATSGQYVWVVDRFANTVEVIEAPRDAVVGSFDLAGAASPDPAPDLLDVAPGGAFAFASLRGACPQTANAPAVNNAVGATPGVGVIMVRSGGLSGELMGVAPISAAAPAAFDCPTRADDAPGSIVNVADPHGIRVRLK